MSKKVVDSVVFTNVAHVYLTDSDGGADVRESEEEDVGTVVVRGGKIICTGSKCLSADELRALGTETEVVDLEGGSILPGLTAYGSALGMGEIMAEPSTQDGEVADGLAANVAPVLANELIRAADGASFGTKDALYVTPPLLFPSFHLFPAGKIFH